jgi:hypothetical protein
MAIRQVLRMIEKREAALARKNGVPGMAPIKHERHYSSDNANEAMRILGIADNDPTHPNRIKVHAWATQAALSRPGRKKFIPRDVDNIKSFTFDSDTLRWPKGRIA